MKTKLLLVLGFATLTLSSPCFAGDPPAVPILSNAANDKSLYYGIAGSTGACVTSIALSRDPGKAAAIGVPILVGGNMLAAKLFHKHPRLANLIQIGSGAGCLAGAVAVHPPASSSFVSTGSQTQPGDPAPGGGSSGGANGGTNGGSSGGSGGNPPGTPSNGGSNGGGSTGNGSVGGTNGGSSGGSNGNGAAGSSAGGSSSGGSNGWSGGSSSGSNGSNGSGSTGSGSVGGGSTGGTNGGSNGGSTGSGSGGPHGCVTGGGHDCGFPGNGGVNPGNGVGTTPPGWGKH